MPDANDARDKWYPRRGNESGEGEPYTKVGTDIQPEDEGILSMRPYRVTKSDDEVLFMTRTASTPAPAATRVNSAQTTL